MKAMVINGELVKWTTAPSGAVAWCSDWGTLVRAYLAGDKRITANHGGSSTYGHVDYFIPVE